MSMIHLGQLGIDIVRRGARDGAGWSVRATHAGRCVAHAVIQERDAHILEFVWFSVGCTHRGQGVVRQVAARFAGRDLYARIL